MSGKLKTPFLGRACGGGQAFLPVTDRPRMTDLLSASGGLRRMVARLILAVSAGSVGVFLFLNAPTSATAADKTVWAKYNNAVPGNTNTTSTDGRIPFGTSGKGDIAYVMYSAVIKDGSTNRMWYSGHDGSNYRIYYAFSTDGLTWKKYTNAIPAASDTTSTDGRVPVGETGGDIKGALRPFVIKDGYTYKMWYAGQDASSKWRIYHALLDALPEGIIFYSH